MTTIKPVFYICKETPNYLDNLALNIRNVIGKDSDLLLNYPSIYIHVWQSKNDTLNGTYSIYIGETNDIIQRTREHWYNALLPKSKRTKGNWQYHMAEDVDINGNKVIPTVFFFGHKSFHKSLTLDLENRLIDYCYAMETAHVYNGRTNPQGNYSGDEELDAIFSMIWKILRSNNSELFLSESSIQKSAIFKASPNHKLTEEQKKAKQLIIDRTVSAISGNKIGQLVFVEGEAGTGKTVLTSSTFYEILESDFFRELDIKSYMLINHEEQKLIYKNTARKLGYDEEIIQNPTGFLKKHSILDPNTNTFEPDSSIVADIVFVDEAHLLWNQRNQAYDRRFLYPQIEEIIRRARVTVIMFDEKQVLHKGQIFELSYMDRMRKLSQCQGPNPKNGENNYIILSNQLRMNCSQETMSWIDSFTNELTLDSLILNKNKDSAGYEIKLFDDPAVMHSEIKKKAKNDLTQLSRIIATCDWPYLNSSAPIWPNRYWTIDIGSWSIPWNEEIFWRDKYGQISKRELKRYKALDWAEKDYSIDEAGSTFTIQGFDLAYSGVIIGPSVRYDKTTNKIWFDETYRFQDYMKGYRTLDDGSRINVTDAISMHELRVLLTRGTKGLYLYACDSDLRERLIQVLGKE